MLKLGIFNNRLNLRIGNIDAENDIGVGLSNIIFDLLLARERVNHVGNGADFIDCVEHINRLWCIWHTDCNVIALLGAESLQGGSDFIDFFNQLFVSDFSIKVLQSRIVWPFAR